MQWKLNSDYIRLNPMVWHVRYQCFAQSTKSHSVTCQSSMVSIVASNCDGSHCQSQIVYVELLPYLGTSVLLRGSRLSNLDSTIFWYVCIVIAQKHCSSWEGGFKIKSPCIFKCKTLNLSFVPNTVPSKHGFNNLESIQFENSCIVILQT